MVKRIILFDISRKLRLKNYDEIYIRYELKNKINKINQNKIKIIPEDVYCGPKGR